MCESAFIWCSINTKTNTKVTLEVVHYMDEMGGQKTLKVDSPLVFRTSYLYQYPMTSSEETD